jgi:hypothetical protein
VDIIPKFLRKYKEGHFILIKGATQKQITIINLYVPRASAPNFIKHTLKYFKSHTTATQY